MVEKMEAVGSELEAIGLKESKEESTGLGSPARGCTCTQARCNCCRHVAVRKVHLDHNGREPDLPSKTMHCSSVHERVVRLEGVWRDACIERRQPRVLLEGSIM